MSFRNFVTDMNPLDFYEYFDDFTDFTAGDWVITTTEAGGGSAAEASIDEPFGALLITNDSNDNDLDFLQLVRETFRFVAGKRFYFAARFKILEVIQCDMRIGLLIRDTTQLDVTDGIYFGVDDGDVKLDFSVEKNNTATLVADIHTLVANTYLTVEFYYAGSGGIQYMVNGVRLGAVALTNVPDDENLTVSFGIQNGEATINTLTIDYLRAVVER